MSAADALLLLLIAGAVAAALRRMRRNKCHCGCDGDCSQCGETKK